MYDTIMMAWITKCNFKSNGGACLSPIHGQPFLLLNQGLDIQNRRAIQHIDPPDV